MGFFSVVYEVLVFFSSLFAEVGVLMGGYRFLSPCDLYLCYVCCFFFFFLSSHSFLVFYCFAPSERINFICCLFSGIFFYLTLPVTYFIKIWVGGKEKKKLSLAYGLRHLFSDVEKRKWEIKG